MLQHHLSSAAFSTDCSPCSVCSNSQRPVLFAKASQRRFPGIPVHLTSSVLRQNRNATTRSRTQDLEVTRAVSESMTASASTTALKLEDVANLTRKALQLQGFSAEETEPILKILMYAELRGNNQGLIKLTSGHLKKPEDAAPYTVEHDTRLSALINGHQSAGMVVMSAAMDMAVKKARKYGFGIVGTNNTCTGTGALGYYAEHMATSGLIGIALCHCPEYVAPHGSNEAIFGTNPFAVGVPSDGAPVVVDMATSAIAYFGLMEALVKGERIPDDVGYDKAGMPTTDPGEVLDGGAIRTFDRSHKGSNIALLVELLAGPLVGAAVHDKLHSRNWGNLIIAIDPGLLGDKATFTAAAAKLLRRVKDARKAPGVEEILLPGERGALATAQRVSSGTLELPITMAADLQRMAAEYDRLHPQGAASRELPTGTSGASTSTDGTSRNGIHHGYRFATLLVRPVTSISDPYLASSPPLYQTATFKQTSATDCGPFDYTRSGNPTRTQLEEHMAALEGADRSFAFVSGMSALSAVCRLVGSGEHIVAGDDLYGGTSRLLSRVVPAAGVEVAHVDTTDISAVSAAILPGRTKLLMLESPTNPRMQVCDIQKLAKIARQAGVLVVVDNSILAPTFQRPLDLGADICMTSATKFISGHADVTAGILSVKGKELADKIYFIQNAEGGGLGPFDCWLAMRGLKTMALRMERAAENAAAIAEYLARHPLVKKVNYPGLPGSPGYEINKRQSTSGGSLLSFETGSLEASRMIVERTALYNVTVSFGSVSSLISLPCYMSHASIPPEVRAARGLPDDLVRISAGIEHIDDLLEDLDAAMEEAMAAIKPK